MQSQHSSIIERTGHLNEHLDIVFMMGEELKKPLTVIKALAESGQESQQSRMIILESKRALRSIDNIIFYKRIDADQMSLPLSPIHIGSTLTQVARDLQPLGYEYGCETEVFIQSGITTVSAHSQVLRSSIESLWQSVIAMTKKPSAMTWYVNRTKAGIKITIINNSIDLSKVGLRKTNNAVGLSSQPLNGVAGPATDLVVATKLLAILGGKLRKTKIRGIEGFTVTLPISEQLALV